MIALDEGKLQLQEQLNTSGTQMIQDEEDSNKKRIIGTLIKRQSDVLDILDCVEAQAKLDYYVNKRKVGGRKLVKILLHPIVSIILSLAAMVSMVLSIQSQEWYVTAVILAVLVAQSIWRLVRESNDREEIPEPEADVFLDMERAELILNRISSKSSIDSESICNMFNTKNLDQLHDFENEVIKIYCSLYEARLDNPDAKDFSYAVTLTQLLMEKLGLKAVIYSPEKEKLFNMERADYHDEMRCPAIVRMKTGELVKRGEYIKGGKA